MQKGTKVKFIGAFNTGHIGTILSSEIITFGKHETLWFRVELRDSERVELIPYANLKKISEEEYFLHCMES